MNKPKSYTIAQLRKAAVKHDPKLKDDPDLDFICRAGHVQIGDDEYVPFGEWSAWLARRPIYERERNVTKLPRRESVKELS